MKLTGITMGASRVSVFRGRHKYIYGVNGATRGFRWDGAASTVEPLGITPPATAATVTASAATSNGVVAINVSTGGVGYTSLPAVNVTGGGGTGAQAAAQIIGGAVRRVVVTASGSGYTCPPQVSFSGGQGTGATLAVGMSGGLARVDITDVGSGYSSATVGFTGVSGAVARVLVTSGKLSDIQILHAGTGATGTATATIYGNGTGGQAACVMSLGVQSVTVSSGGAGYSGKVAVKFAANTNDLIGDGAEAYLTANTVTGALTNPVITDKGQYRLAPAATPLIAHAEASAVMRPPQIGSYRCCYRFVDDTPEAEGGPCASSISDLTTVSAGSGSQTFTWTWSNAAADSRAKYVELWRTSCNQAIVLYRVAKLALVNGSPTTYSDSMAEEELLNPTRADYAVMPITLPSGQLNARRFTPPPTTMADACWFQDRAWFAVSTDGSRPNSILFSEVDEPESVPEVNEVVLQENAGVQDKITAIIPFGHVLLIAQESHMYRMQYVRQPVIDANVLLASYRGVLNKRCWTSYEGVLFCVDSFGAYAYDGQSAEPISAAVDNYWRDGVIDFTKSAAFFVQMDPASRVLRFHYCKTSDSGLPPRALCYCLSTKAWWEEEYSQPVGAAAVVTVAKKQRLVAGLNSGAICKFGSGLQDISPAGANAGIAFTLRTPPLTLVDEPTRHVGVLYMPTQNAATLTLNAHYNNSSSPRPNAISSDRGEGVVSSPAGAAIDMRRGRTALGESNGTATARYSGRWTDRSAGGDQHLAVSFAGTQTSDQVAMYAVTIGGVTA
jgi:hypothetical protein